VKQLGEIAWQMARQRGAWKAVKIGFSLLMWKTANRVLVHSMIRKFEIRSAQVKTVDQALDLAFSFEYLGSTIAPIQVRSEITALLDIVRDLKPCVVLEIGTAKGGTLFLLTRVVPDGARLVSVDLPGGLLGGGYPESMLKLMSAFAVGNQEIRFIRSDSHAGETRKMVEEACGHRPVDFLFIDGDHSYEGVKKDYEMYSSLVRNGGIIAFHDICPGTPENVGGVPEFWVEISSSGRSKAIIQDLNQGRCGIGVLFRWPLVRTDIDAEEV